MVVLYLHLLACGCGECLGEQVIALVKQDCVSVQVTGVECKTELTYEAVFTSLATLVVTIITIVACAAPNYKSTSWVFGSTNAANKSWSKGTLFLLCLLNNIYGFLGIDAGAHMSEEIPNPRVNSPKVIVSHKKSRYLFHIVFSAC